MQMVLWNPNPFWLKFLATTPLFCPSGSAPNASTMAGAAMNIDMASDMTPANATTVAEVPAGAVTVDVAELMLERERLAMDREALRSFVVERHYVRGPDNSDDEYWSWKRAFELQADMLQSIGDQAAEVDDLAHSTNLEYEVNARMTEMRAELKEAVQVSREITANSRSGTLSQR